MIYVHLRQVRCACPLVLWKIHPKQWGTSSLTHHPVCTAILSSFPSTHGVEEQICDFVCSLELTRIRVVDEMDKGDNQNV